MTAALKLAIRTTLTNDSAYIVAVGSPTSVPYNTFYLYPPQPPTFPQVVFWVRPGRFEPTNGRDILSTNYDLHFFIWSQNGNCETIKDRIIYLLHQVGNSSNGFRTILNSEPEEVYDEKLNAWGVHIVFNLFYRREII